MIRKSINSRLEWDFILSEAEKFRVVGNQKINRVERELYFMLQILLSQHDNEVNQKKEFLSNIYNETKLAYCRLKY